MSGPGQTQTSADRLGMFDLPPIADIVRLRAQVCLVPLTAVSNRSTAASAAWPLAALDQGQEQGARIADARVLTGRAERERTLTPVGSVAAKSVETFGPDRFDHPDHPHHRPFRRL
jgi:hypothetical protein